LKREAYDGDRLSWCAPHLAPASGREAMADAPNDCRHRPYRTSAGEDARERYLPWKIELIRQMEREGETWVSPSAIRPL